MSEERLMSPAVLMTWGNNSALSDSEQRENECARTQLARLIQARDEPLSAQEQIHQVDVLMKIVEKHGDCLTMASRFGMLPLQEAVENDLPLEMIRILATGYPNAVVVKYYPTRESVTTVIRRARTAAILECLLDQAMRYLDESLLQDGGGWDQVQSFFSFHNDMNVVVERLIAEFPDFVRKTGRFAGPDYLGFELPLHHAVANGAPVQVLMLLVSAYPRALTTKNCDGLLPVHIASSIGLPEELQVMEMLASRKALGIYDDTHSLALHRYCARGTESRALTLQVVELMVERYPNAVRKLDGNKRSPLHLLCQRPVENHLPIIQFLVQASPASLKVTDITGDTPVHTAFQNVGEKSLPVLRLLTEACPESIRRVDRFGHTLLHRYCRHASKIQLSIVKLLVEIYPEALALKDYVRHMTPLHIACESAMTFQGDHVEQIRFMAQAYPQVLETHGNKAGTPLHTLCEGIGSLPRNYYEAVPLRFSKILEILLDASEKAMEAKDSRGQTPIHVLCQGRSSRYFLHVIVEQCPSAAGLRDNDGRIPLHTAIESCALAGERNPSLQSLLEDTIQYLLEEFPSGVHATDNNGVTPLVLACEGNVNLDIIYQMVKIDPVSFWSSIPVEHKPQSGGLWKGIFSALSGLVGG